MSEHCLPTRDECNCVCHTLGAMHVVACCSGLSETVAQVWTYELDTDDFVTTGQIRLKSDGTVEQRVFLSSQGKFAEWQPAVRWTGNENTVDSVEANRGPFYELTRIHA